MKWDRAMHDVLPFQQVDSFEANISLRLPVSEQNASTHHRFQSEISLWDSLNMIQDKNHSVLLDVLAVWCILSRYLRAYILQSITYLLFIVSDVTYMITSMQSLIEKHSRNHVIIYALFQMKVFTQTNFVTHFILQFYWQNSQPYVLSHT